MSLPATLPVRSVRRIFCEHCERLCEAAAVSEVKPGLGDRVRVDLRWLTLPVAAIGVFAILSLLNGDDMPVPETSATTTASKPAKAPALADTKVKDKAAQDDGPAKAAVPADAQLVSETSFSLALPAGWDRVKPAAGATFAAISSDGAADATLWITNEPKLDFATFEATSLAQLETLAGSARVVERNVGPSVEASSITLAPKEVPSGSPTYQVVLRASRDNWYHLATTYQDGAPAEAVEGVNLIQGSFLPLGGKG